MKNLLAISSSTKKAYIALKTEKFSDFCEIDANCKQSENILYQIDELLSRHEMTIDDINNIAVVVGPGSFTGVRIGVALVKGFCAGNREINVYPVSSFDFMAETVEAPQEDFVCVINALSGLYFIKKFDKNKKAISKESMITAEELADIKGKKIGLEEENVCERKIELNAEALLALSQKVISEEKSVKPEHLTPIYLRNSQAEENLNKNKKTS